MPQRISAPQAPASSEQVFARIAAGLSAARRMFRQRPPTADLPEQPRSPW